MKPETVVTVGLSKCQGMKVISVELSDFVQEAVAIVNLFTDIVFSFHTAVCLNFCGAHYKSRKDASFMPGEKVSLRPIAHSWLSVTKHCVTDH